tara:strand:- start:13 stop:714 length:702 start_codon:yes stop_codon:yes gene_type:complete
MRNDFNRVLIIAAHPDDDILGCGGLINKLKKQNKEVRVAFMAEGISSRYDLNKSDKSELIQKEINHRESCAIEALKTLGLSSDNIFFSKRKCCQLDIYPLLEITKNIELHIEDFSPTCLITHFEQDTNIDHRLTYQASLPAIRPTKSISIKLVLSFEILSSTEWNYSEQFRPNFFLDINEELENKLNACMKYDKEISKENDKRSIEAIKTLARFRGLQSGHYYSEAFKLIVKR